MGSPPRSRLGPSCGSLVTALRQQLGVDLRSLGRRELGGAPASLGTDLLAQGVVAQQFEHPFGHQARVRALEHDPGDPVDDDLVHSAEGKRDERATRHRGFDRDAGDAFDVARQQRDVDSAEHPLDVVAVTEQGDVVVEPPVVDLTLEQATERSVAGHDEVGLIAGGPHFGQDFDGPLGSLLVDEVAHEADEVRRGRDPDLIAQAGAFHVTVDLEEALRSTEVRDHPEGSSKAEPAHLVRLVVGEGNGSVHVAGHHPPQPASRLPADLLGEPEDLLPDDRRSVPGEACDRHLCRQPAVGEDDVGALTLEQTTEAPRRAQPADAAEGFGVDERGKRRILAPFEAEYQCDDLVPMAELVELLCEIQSDAFGAPPLASRDDVDDVHTASWHAPDVVCPGIRSARRPRPSTAGGLRTTELQLLQSRWRIGLVRGSFPCK